MTRSQCYLFETEQGSDHGGDVALLRHRDHEVIHGDILPDICQGQRFLLLVKSLYRDITSHPDFSIKLSLSAMEIISLKRYLVSDELQLFSF